MIYSGPGGDPGDQHQRVLAAAVADVLARLDAGVAARSARSGRSGRAGWRGRATPESRPGPEAAEAQAEAGPSALETLCACFGLTRFERDVLVLTAAVEVDPTAAERCAAAAGDPRRPYPTFSLALAMLREPHWSALTPVAALRRWLLVEVADGPVTTSRLRIDERILHFLTGVPYLDPRLHGLARLVSPPPDLPPAHQRVAGALGTCWTTGELGMPPHAELCGADPRTRREVAASAARAAGLALYAIHAAELPADPGERHLLARLWEREAILLPAALLVEAEEAASARLVAEFTAELDVPLVVSAADPLPSAARRERLTLAPLSRSEQRRLWSAVLTGVVEVPEEELGRLVAQFSLPAHVIRTAGAAVRRRIQAAHRSGEPVADAAELAWWAARSESRIALDELGHRIEPRARWDDLVLPPEQRAVLKEIVAHVRQRATVYETWGFEAVLRRGLGVTALFAGASGTGKTLAAEVIAGELGLDLFVIDLSQVVSKYIGETEKNLRRVFDAAEAGSAVLLFDEADALFGKRGEVKDSHDRYANIEVSYLLMRMEAYRGLAILTTNLKKALDPAFLRRLRFVVEFPFPGPAERAEIWRRVVPAQAPAQDLDPERLAQLTVAGGNIRTIALSAAFLAADEGVPLGMRHVLAAARTEYRKLERSLTPAEVAGWP